MLRLLLDESISPEVARQVTTARPDITIYSAHTWQDGRLRGATDEQILRAANEASLTLVTYDVSTIPLLLLRLANEGFTHRGVIFISSAIRSNDYGTLARSLIRLHDDHLATDWRDRVVYLQAYTPPST